MGAAHLAAAFRPFKKDKGTSDSKEKEDKEPSTRSLVALFLLLMVQLLVLAPVLVLVAALYVLGLYISAGISLWRLIEHDYGGEGEGGANLKPALNVLYSLAVAQGVVFGYKTVYDMVARAGLVQKVAYYYSLDTDLVKDYLDEIVTGCMKDPSFARGRNLITYGVDLLMESKSRYGYLCGVLILGTILQPRRYERIGQHDLIKQLLKGSASFGHVVQRLVETFGPTSPYSTGIREHAARIVANVAGSIHLEEQVPGGAMIQCVSSLLDTFEEYSWRPEGYDDIDDRPWGCERDWVLEEKEFYLYTDRIRRPSDANRKKQGSDSVNLLQGYKGLVVQGLRILQGLAVHEGNCRVIMSNTTEGPLSKTMALLIWDQLHKDNHDEWSEIAEESMELMSRLMAAPGDTGSKLRSEIKDSGQAEIFANRILECSKCRVLLKRQAIELLLDLPVDTVPSIIKSSGSNNIIIIGSLLHIFLLPDYCLDPRNVSILRYIMPMRYRSYSQYYRKMGGSTHLAKKSSYITRLAGEKLQSAVLSSQDEASANKSMSLQSSVAAIFADLARTSVDVTISFSYRLHVVQILEDLCWFYTKGEYHKELKNAMADVMPKVLKEILCFGSTSAGIHAKAEASCSDQVSARRTDIEKGVVPRGDGQEDASSSQQQNGDQQQEGIKLQEALISMCNAIPYSWTDEFNDLAEKMCLEQGIPKKYFYSLLRYAEDLLEEQKKAQGIMATKA